MQAIRVLSIALLLSGSSIIAEYKQSRQYLVCTPEKHNMLNDKQFVYVADKQGTTSFFDLSSPHVVLRQALMHKAMSDLYQRECLDMPTEECMQVAEMVHVTAISYSFVSARQKDFLAAVIDAQNAEFFENILTEIQENDCADTEKNESAATVESSDNN